MTVAAPASINKHDSAKYSVSFVEDPAIAFNSEDSLQITRPRYSRGLRREHTLGFTFVTNVVKDEIETLYKTAKGGSEIITGFKDPVTGAALSVRFKRGQVPSFQYRGRGGAHYWDVSGFILVEV